MGGAAAGYPEGSRHPQVRNRVRQISTTFSTPGMVERMPFTQGLTS